jgi:hypothetical protein
MNHFEHIYLTYIYRFLSQHFNRARTISGFNEIVLIKVCNSAKNKVIEWKMQIKKTKSRDRQITLHGSHMCMR